MRNRIESLSPVKRALLEKVLREKGVASTGTKKIAPRPEGAAVPLSFAQERLWVIDQIEPDNPAYIRPLAFRLTGQLQLGALSAGLSEIVRRHEILRTTFSLKDGFPIQVVHPPLPLPIRVEDLSAMTEDRREADVCRLMDDELRSLFDLARGPLLRATLLRLTGDRYILLIVMHHIVFDGWSSELFLRELTMLYGAYAGGAPAALPELPVQYGDFAFWQREWLQGEVLATQLAYWREQLAGIPPVLELPADRPRSSRQSYRGAMRTVTIPRALSDGLKSVGRREGATLFMTLLAAFTVLLHRYTGQDDIVVGSPIANRNRIETEGLIGFFVNTLVLRADLSGDPSFQELLKRTRKTCLGAYSHQDFPFEKLVEDLQPERNLDHSPLFNVWVNFIDSPSPSCESGGMTFSPSDISEPIARWPLTLYAIQKRNSLCLRLVYQLDLFSEELMSIFLEQFHHLLLQIVASPYKQIRSYTLITPGTSPLLPDPSAFLSEPEQEPVTAMFASWAKKLSEQPAVTQHKREWTYGELAERSKALSQNLRSLCSQRKNVVAVSGSRSFGLIAAMLGILENGDVLLPIDRNLPKERQLFMLREAGVRTLLHVSENSAACSWLENELRLNVLSIDAGTGHLRDIKTCQSPKELKSSETCPDDAAYIFFTSGTTGVPKGVLGSHRGLSHFVTWQRETFAVGPQDRCAQLTGLSFDVVLRDIFLPLTSGATLCLPADDFTLDSDNVLSWLDLEQISLLHAVPALAQSWLTELSSGVSLRAMRYVFFAGEPLTDALVHEWRDTFPESGEIINLYGPTETTLAKCYYRVRPNVLPGIQPIGRPLPQTQALVMGPNVQMCGIGEPGEIVIRTPFRSLGYIHMPEENRQRFSRNPFRSDDADLLYFTGDRGRYRPDGSIDILGRLDDQVKIRGVRVEPAEVAAVLARHADVKACHVVCWTDEKNQSRLVAYAVMDKNKHAEISHVRTYLSEYLPSAMIPDYFVFLDHLPLTPNGKVDRRALPAPDNSRLELEGAYVSPQTPVEQAIAEIWAEVLRLERVGVHDNFFHIGGHSLLATQVISRIRNLFQVEIPLRSLFEAPTVAGLAQDLVQHYYVLSETHTGLADVLADLETLSEVEAVRLTEQ